MSPQFVIFSLTMSEMLFRIMYLPVSLAKILFPLSLPSSFYVPGQYIIVTQKIPCCIVLGRRDKLTKMVGIGLKFPFVIVVITTNL